MKFLEASLDRLLLWQKFIILSIIALVVAAIPAALYLQETTATIAAAESEIEGQAPVAAIFKVIQLTQQHRGLAALLLGGSAEAAAKRAAKQQEADLAYERMDAMVKGVHNAALEEVWRLSRQQWQALRDRIGGGSLTVAQSYAAHTVLLRSLLVVNDLTADSFGLQLDPNPDSYQLIQAVCYQMPYLAEETGRLRAMGTALLNRHEASVEEREALGAAIARVQDRLLQTGTALQKAAAANRAVHASLGGQWQHAEELANGVIALANSRIVKAEQLDYASSDYLARVTAAIDAQFALNGSAAKLLEGMLNEKIVALRSKRLTMLGAMVALIGLAGLVGFLIACSVSRPLAQAVDISRRIAKGDLTARFQLGGRSETAQLMQALKEMNDGLVGIVTSVRGSVQSIDSASCDISSGNLDLSNRTETQASKLQETAASMEQITSNVRQSADNARSADSLVGSAASVATRGGAVVHQVVQTMGEINEASRRIADIIGVIDGIAFQTNILALNAAVEAARAGDQGRGFAVVATEVRNLAQRSAAAAKEIKGLIDNSVRKVESGNALAADAGLAMNEVVSSVQRITTIMSDIVQAAQEQSVGIEQINLAIAQIDEMTQQNAALVEQSAAASESLKQQAGALSEAVAVFSLERATPDRSRLT